MSESLYYIVWSSDPESFDFSKPLLAEPELSPTIEKNLGVKQEEIVYGAIAAAK